jgi:hypothetical protein
MAVSKLAPQPVAFYAAVFFLVNATYVCLIWELVRAHEVSPAVRGIMRFRSVTTLCLFGIAAIVAAEISTGWTRYLHLLPDRLSETRSARIGEVKISRKTQAPPRPFGRFVDLSAVRHDPAPLWLCRFCASALAKSSGCQPLGN